MSIRYFFICYVQTIKQEEHTKKSVWRSLKYSKHIKTNITLEIYIVHLSSNKILLKKTIDRCNLSIHLFAI